MGLSLKLELKSNSHVLVTNLETKEQIEVTSNFIQKITKSSFSMLIQNKYYELIIDADKYWNYIKKFEPELETKIIKEIEIREKEIIQNIKTNIKQKLRQETIAKQQHWNKIAAYNKVQKHWINDGYKIILQSRQSYNKALIALQYADYCLKHNYPYNSEQNTNQNSTFKINLEDRSKEEKIIALKEENQALRARITELETKYIRD